MLSGTGSGNSWNVRFRGLGNKDGSLDVTNNIHPGTLIGDFLNLLMAFTSCSNNLCLSLLNVIKVIKYILNQFQSMSFVIST